MSFIFRQLLKIRILPTIMNSFNLYRSQFVYAINLILISKSFQVNVQVRFCLKREPKLSIMFLTWNGPLKTKRDQCNLSTIHLLQRLLWHTGMNKKPFAQKKPARQCKKHDGQFEDFWSPRQFKTFWNKIFLDALPQVKRITRSQKHLLVKSTGLELEWLKLLSGYNWIYYALYQILQFNKKLSPISKLGGPLKFCRQYLRKI